MASLEQISTVIANATNFTGGEIGKLRNDVKAVAELLNQLTQMVKDVELRTRVTEQAVQKQAEESSKAGSRSGSTKVMAVNHRFTKMAKDAHKNQKFAQQWESFKTGQYAQRFATALTSVQEQKKASPTSELQDDSKFQTRLASVLWGYITDPEKTQFRQWSDSPDIKGFWSEGEGSTGGTPESTVSTPSGSTFGMGGAPLGGNATFSAASVLGDGFKPFSA